MKRLTTLILLALLLVGGALTAIAQDVDEPIGNIPPGQQVTITYDVTVNENLPQGLQYIINQGTVTGSNIDAILSNDPDTPEQANDTTRTRVGFTLDVEELPSTGETPWYRIVLLSGLFALVVSAGGFVASRKFAR